ncbi:uncharacterized protein L969DRAFT_96943 [Mixia osmundae IAM 14324]|uniref:GCF C-terminal domain-containing protein n=1 Tax=Mixia osmundae (strain CBS 9802 / IAM 14324 / JCM 22182 / KY 12970) TaxID=764103 RepID=G7E2J7_MIXOS|nr:uncharacterized protein L969DRAFT_96943 [Mixia osmundae IAM 14324]KEI36929.1 hypothetical protein L969DRAFT_96943 [Mixia osmundae IAM 14324]GAA97057.1 hypothetical protein E5Q_03732 [Mixia osmundae IAM 14324]
MLDEEEAPTVIKRRARPSGGARAGGLTSSTSSSSLRQPETPIRKPDDFRASTPSSLHGHEDEDDATVSVVVRRDKQKTPAGRTFLRGSAQSATAAERRAANSALANEFKPSAIALDDDITDEGLSNQASQVVIDRELGTPSRKLTRGLSPVNLERSNAPSPMAYSAEHLAELRQATAIAPADSPRSAPAYDELTLSKFASTSALSRQYDTEEPETAYEAVELPSSAAIAEAKSKRDYMRKMGIIQPQNSSAAQDFISLDIVNAPAKGGDSRFVREEDEVGDGDDDMADFTGARETMPLVKNPLAKMASDRRDDIIRMIDDADDDAAMPMDEEDEEVREWEDAQIKRGDQSRRTQNGATQIKRVHRSSKIPQLTSLPSIGFVRARLRSSLTFAQSTHSSQADTLQKCEKEVEKLDQHELELRADIDATNARFEWFQEFRAWIEDVAAFLETKYPALEKIEADNLAIQKERLDLVQRRRYEDDSDDLALFTGVATPSIYRLPTLIEAESDDIVDDLQRIPPQDALREARRLARRHRHAQRRQSASLPVQDREEPEGDSTDDELEPSDTLDLEDAVRDLYRQHQLLFQDVAAEDFVDPDLGLRARFGQWREKHHEEYANAFGGLAMVSAWEYWARAEMGLWNPFDIAQFPRTTASLEEYRWHASLGQYAHRRESSAMSEEEHAANGKTEDDNVLAALVASAVMPRLEAFAKDALDPYSSRATRLALHWIEEVGYVIQPDSTRFETLLQAFLLPTRQAVTRLQSLVAPLLDQINLPSSKIDASAIHARSRMLRRSFKLLVQAMRWRRYAVKLRLASSTAVVGTAGTWDDLLVTEMVTKVLLPLIEASWDTGGHEQARKILDLLPAEVVPSALARRLGRNFARK